MEVAAAIPLELLLQHGDSKGLCQAVQLYMKRVMAIQVSVMKLFLQLNARRRLTLDRKLLACLPLISGGAIGPLQGALENDESRVRDEATAGDDSGNRI